MFSCDPATDFVENLKVETRDEKLSGFLSRFHYLDLAKLRHYFEDSRRVRSCGSCTYWTVSEIALEFHETKCPGNPVNSVVGNGISGGGSSTICRLTASTGGKRSNECLNMIEKKLTRMEMMD